MKKYLVKDNTHIDLHLDPSTSYVNSDHQQHKHQLENTFNPGHDLGSVLVTKVTDPIVDHGPHLREVGGTKSDIYSKLHRASRTDIVVRRSSIENGFSVVGIGKSVLEKELPSHPYLHPSPSDFRGLAKRRASVPEHAFRPTDKRLHELKTGHHDHPHVHYLNITHGEMRSRKHSLDDRLLHKKHSRKSSVKSDKTGSRSSTRETSPVNSTEEDQEDEGNEEQGEDCKENSPDNATSDLVDISRYSFKKDITIGEGNDIGRILNSVAELIDGQVVVADVSQEEIIVFNQSLEMLKSLRCSHIWRLCAVPDHTFTLAIIFENDTKITLTDLESNKKSLHVHSNGEFFRDIRCHGNEDMHLYVLCSNSIIVVVDMKGKVVREIETSLADTLHMTFVMDQGEEEIFYCSGKSSVAFINSSGHEIWRYSGEHIEHEDVAITTQEIEETVAGRPHEHHVLSPHGLAVTDDTLYVTDTQNHRVIAISLEYHSSSEVISVGVKFPFAVCYIRNESLMITQNSYVTTSRENNTIKVFKYV